MAPDLAIREQRLLLLNRLVTLILGVADISEIVGEDVKST
jgi:glycyl-tRNA synthetase beta subunit